MLTIHLNPNLRICAEQWFPREDPDGRDIYYDTKDRILYNGDEYHFAEGPHYTRIYPGDYIGNFILDQSIGVTSFSQWQVFGKNFFESLIKTLTK